MRPRHLGTTLFRYFKKTAASAYKAWCEGNGRDALSARRFGSMVAERAGVTKKRTNAGNVYVGVRLV